MAVEAGAWVRLGAGRGCGYSRVMPRRWLTRRRVYQAREVLADVKAVWDPDVTTPNPRYLGNPEHLDLQPIG